VFSVNSGIQQPKNTAKDQVERKAKIEDQFQPSSLLEDPFDDFPQQPSTAPENQLQEDVDPMTIPDIREVLMQVPDYDPAVLYDLYCQVGKDKGQLLAAIENGGMLPEHLEDPGVHQQQQF